MNILRTVYKHKGQVLAMSGSAKITTPDGIVFINQDGLSVDFPELTYIEIVTMIRGKGYVPTGGTQTKKYSFIGEYNLGYGVLHKIGKGDFLLVMFNCSNSWEDHFAELELRELAGCNVIAQIGGAGLSGAAMGIPNNLGPEGLKVPYMVSKVLNDWASFEKALLEQERA